MLPATLDLWRDASMGRAVNVYGRTSYSDKTSMDIVRQGWVEQRKTDPRVRLGDFRACDVFDRMAAIQNIAVPTLVVCGADDVVTPPKYAQYLSAQIPGAQLAMIPDAGHASYAEQPEALSQALTAFLDRLSPTSPVTGG